MHPIVSPAFDDPLIFGTYLAPCSVEAYRFVAEQVGDAVGRGGRLVVGRSFDEVIHGDIDVAFICGWPYVRLAAEHPGRIDLVAAPVLSEPRYQGQPIYFSDVIVRQDSAFQRFEDLRGCSWAYNEPSSYSGYLATLYHLVKIGETGRFFGQAIAAGTHQESIRMVADREADAAAIDSQVLEVEFRRRPELRKTLRIIETFGPAPIQPVVVSHRLDSGLRHDIGAAVITVAGEPMRACLFQAFVPVDDAAYEPIREAERRVKAADLTSLT